VPTTFGDVYSGVLLRTPGADPLLVREWVQEAYEAACDAKVWSHQRVESSIIINDQHAGTLTATRGSATISVGAGTMVLVAADVGRQIRQASIPLYTIISVDTMAQTAVLDRIYAETTGLQAFTILDAYWTAPEDFWRFNAVLDPTNKWKLRWWITEDILNKVDPARQATGSPWLLASQAYSPVVADLGKPRYEVWPYCVSARSLYVMYYSKPTILSEDTPLIGPFSRGGKDLLVQGALARCALWPGTAALKNPYFDLRLAEMHEKSFQARLQNLESKDEDLYPTYLPMAEYTWSPYPLDSNYLQSHVPETIESVYY